MAGQYELRAWVMGCFSLFSQRGISFRVAVAGAFLALSAATTGCSTIAISVGSGAAPTPTTYQPLTGNWEFVVTPTQVVAPFGSMAGFVTQGQPASSSANAAAATLFATLQAGQQSGCFQGTTLIPLSGTAQSAQVGLYSFSINGQYFDSSMTRDMAGDQLTGNYVVEDGCAGAQGDQGTLSGMRYTPLSGGYKGSIPGGSSGTSLNLLLSQSTVGNGDGTSSISGSASLTGVTCFSTATLTVSSSSVLGKNVHLVFQTSEAASSLLILDGFSDPAGELIIVSSSQIVGGTCVGPLASSTFTLSK